MIILAERYELHINTVDYPRKKRSLLKYFKLAELAIAISQKLSIILLPLLQH
ncbi:MAG: hypothetical protein ACRC80_13845 [Waterburya sp.]